jgi:hypothetical protein
VTLIANAIGLILAAVILDDVALSVAAFVIALLIFTAVEVVAQPLIIKIGFRHAQPVAGASALIATFAVFNRAVDTRRDQDRRPGRTW